MKMSRPDTREKVQERRTASELTLDDRESAVLRKIEKDARGGREKEERSRGDTRQEGNNVTILPTTRCARIERREAKS